MAAICHTYPGINPINIWEIDFELIKDLVAAIPKVPQQR